LLEKAPLRRVGKERQSVLEQFKRGFYLIEGRPPSWSSSPDYAAHDLRESMRDAAKSPQLFLEALYDGIESVRTAGTHHVPDVEHLNEICRHTGVPYQLAPPELLRLVADRVAVAQPTPPASLTQQAAAVLDTSMRRAEELLAENRPREAVQESLWMLESFTTAFRGANTSTGKIQGKYFNKIAKELRKASVGTTLAQVIDWVTALHGYASSPTGGGVRHGADLNTIPTLTQAEGRLFVNLILSYVSFLLSEHERISAAPV
jgi:hypothetical protein